MSHRFLFAGMSVLLCAHVFAQSDDYTGVAALRRDFPAGSIHSIARSQAAKDRLAQVNSSLAQEYAARQKNCYKNFFATRCLDQATALYRQANRDIERIELEDRRFDRQQQVLKRARDLAQRRLSEAHRKIQRERQAEARAERIIVHQRQQEHRAADQEERAEHAQQQRTEVQRKIDERAANYQETLAERAENARKYAEKLRAAQEKIDARHTRRMEKAAQDGRVAQPE